MSKDSTLAVAAKGKGAAPSNELIATQFGGLAVVARKALSVALKGGVNAAAIFAVVTFNVASVGGSKAQAHNLLFGAEKPAKHDSGEAKLWRAGLALAGHWRSKGAVPITVASANSEESAFVAACDWLEAEGISSVMGLEAWLAAQKGVTAPATERGKTPLPERIGKAISKAEKESDLSVADVEAMAKLMVDAMGFGNASAFGAAVTAALAAKSEVLAAAGATLATELAEAV